MIVLQCQVIISKVNERIPLIMTGRIGTHAMALQAPDVRNAQHDQYSLFRRTLYISAAANAYRQPSYPFVKIRCATGRCLTNSRIFRSFAISILAFWSNISEIRDNRVLKV
jgi:hypothetical protein